MEGAAGGMAERRGGRPVGGRQLASTNFGLKVALAENFRKKVKIN